MELFYYEYYIIFYDQFLYENENLLLKCMDKEFILICMIILVLKCFIYDSVFVY